MGGARGDGAGLAGGGSPGLRGPSAGHQLPSDSAGRRGGGAEQRDSMALVPSGGKGTGVFRLFFRTPKRGFEDSIAKLGYRVQQSKLGVANNRAPFWCGWFELALLFADRNGALVSSFTLTLWLD